MNPAPTTAGHTALPSATPWEIDGGFIIDGDKRTIADCHCMSDPTPEMSLEMDANAELICRAVNNHAALVAALQAILAGVDKPGGTIRSITADSISQARSALAAAKEGAK